jgi:hypothetical protein
MTAMTRVTTTRATMRVTMMMAMTRATMKATTMRATMRATMTRAMTRVTTTTATMRATTTTTTPPPPPPQFALHNHEQWLNDRFKAPLRVLEEEREQGYHHHDGRPCLSMPTGLVLCSTVMDQSMNHPK